MFLRKLFAWCRLLIKAVDYTYLPHTKYQVSDIYAVGYDCFYGRRVTCHVSSFHAARLCAIIYLPQDVIKSVAGVNEECRRLDLTCALPPSQLQPLYQAQKYHHMMTHIMPSAMKSLE